jgi:hypothetical protein
MTTQEEQQVRTMRAAGIDAEQIAEVLGLPIGEVRGVLVVKPAAPVATQRKTRPAAPMHPSFEGLEKARKELGRRTGGSLRQRLAEDGHIPGEGVYGPHRRRGVGL